MVGRCPQIDIGLIMVGLRVALAGLGAVGLPVAEVLLSGGIPGMSLVAVSSSSKSSATAKLANLVGGDSVACVPLAELDSMRTLLWKGRLRPGFSRQLSPH